MNDKQKLIYAFFITSFWLILPAEEATFASIIFSISAMILHSIDTFTVFLSFLLKTIIGSLIIYLLFYAPEKHESIKGIISSTLASILN
ncbi:MAG: hypothetical protein IJ262_03735 [Clostridia bacterium]|nr:hypothetical protein [Clostridia bacterium]